MWFTSVPEFVGTAMLASPELVQFSMWPFFHPQIQQKPELILNSEEMAQRMSRRKGKLTIRHKRVGSSWPEQREEESCHLGRIAGNRSLKQTLLVSLVVVKETDYLGHHMAVR